MLNSFGVPEIYQGIFRENKKSYAHIKLSIRRKSSVQALASGSYKPQLYPYERIKLTKKRKQFQ